MTKVLILGGSGMLGHKLWQRLSGAFDTHVTFRSSARAMLKSGLFDPSRAIENVHAEDIDSVARTLATARPDVVVNCIGIVKQAAAAADPLPCIRVNALFPHLLAQACRTAGARLIHISTDCVFSGSKGGYVESDVSDAQDLYGRTKYLGEVGGDGCLTLRTSMVGRELRTSNGLIEWFLTQQDKTVRGYSRAVFSGFTTLELAKIVEQIIARWPDLEGVWHVAAQPISKLQVLTLVRQAFDLNIRIETDTDVVCDRSLCGKRFREATGYVTPSWPEMIEGMRDDPTPYAEIRRRYAD